MHLSNYYNRVTAIFMVVTFLLLLGSGAVIHYCFDGKEPAVSLTFGNMAFDYDCVEGEGGCIDSDKLALSEKRSMKYFEFTSLIFLSSLLIIFLSPVRTVHYHRLSNEILWFQFFVYLPPLRAPPIAS